MMRVATGYGVKAAWGKLWRQILAIALLFGVAAPVLAEPMRIVALGDSLVAGYGLEGDQGFVPQMQGWLDRAGVDVELVNAGVSGDTTSGALARLDWALGGGADAMIVELGGNDILRAIAPELAQANLTAILERAEAEGLPVLLVGIVVPPNYGAEYQDQFSAIYPALADQFATLLYPDFLGIFTQSGERAATYQDWFQPDGLHPNARGMARIVEDMGPLVRDLARRAAD